MIQDVGFHWSIKDELTSDSNYPKFTEMINTSPSSSIEDLHLHNLNDQRNLNDMMSEKLFLRNFNGLHLPPPDNFYSNGNPHNGTSTSAPSRATFSQIFPSINISNFGQSSSIISNSLGMSLEALDLFNSPRFSGSFSQPSSHDQLADLSYNCVDHLQQWSHRPTTSPSKVGTLLIFFTYSFFLYFLLKNFVVLNDVADLPKISINAYLAYDLVHKIWSNKLFSISLLSILSNFSGTLISREA